MDDLEYLGELSLGAVLPLAAVAAATMTASITIPALEIQAKLDGALEAQARLTLNPPTLAGNLEAAQQLVANLQAAIALGLPSASLSLTGLAQVVEDLQAKVTELAAALAFAASFTVTLGSPGIHAYRYGGDDGGAVPTLGSLLASELSGGLPGGLPSDLAKAIILIATDPGAQSALEAMFAG